MIGNLFASWELQAETRDTPEGITPYNVENSSRTALSCMGPCAIRMALFTVQMHHSEANVDVCDSGVGRAGPTQSTCGCCATFAEPPNTSNRKCPVPVPIDPLTPRDSSFRRAANTSHRTAIFQLRYNAQFEQYAQQLAVPSPTPLPRA